MAKRTRQLYNPTGKLRCRISHAEGRRLERAGLVFKVWTLSESGQKTGEFIWQEVRIDASESKQTAPTITMRECVANAGLSLSIGQIRAARAKVRLWPEIHDDRSVCISAGRVIGATPVSVIEHDRSLLLSWHS